MHICKDACGVAGAIQGDMFTRDVKRSGRRFPESGCILERQIFRFAKIILRDRRNTSYTWPHFVVAGAVL